MFRILILAALPAIALALNAREFVCALNNARRSNALPAVGLATELVASATTQAEDMARRGQLTKQGSNGSNPNQRMAAAGFTCIRCSEIVAYNLKDDAKLFDSFNSVFAFKMDLLSTTMENVGIAVAYSSSGEAYYALDLGKDSKGVRTVKC